MQLFFAASTDEVKVIYCYVGTIRQCALSVLLWFWGCSSDSISDDWGYSLNNILTHREDPIFCGQLVFHAVIILCLKDPLECS